MLLNATGKPLHNIAQMSLGIDSQPCASALRWQCHSWHDIVTLLDFPMRRPWAHSARCCAGGWLYQEADSLKPEEIEFTSVSDTKPTEQQLEDLKFAWRIVKHVKSNAITVAKDGRLLGMGSGQPNRVKSTEIALEKAAEEAKV